MSDDSQKSPDPAETRRLESWKEIAEYLRREVRTVQRWERDQGLPVRRHTHQKRSSVYAIPQELDAWRNTKAPVTNPPQSADWSRRAKLMTATAAVLLGLVSVLGWRAWSLSRVSTPFLKTEIQPLIATGNAVSVAISPDGLYLAYSLAGMDGRSLWMKDLISGINTQLGASAESDYRDLKFSTDGTLLRFFQDDGLHEMPIRGGPVTKIARGMPGYLALSPDGKRMAIRRRVKNETVIVVANLDGSGEQRIAVRKSPDSLQRFSWSPDGKRIACVVGSSIFAGTDATVIVVDLESGRESVISARKWWSINSLAWLANGRGLLLVARELPLKVFRPWYLSFPEGETHQITNDLLDYTSVSSTNDSSSFVSVQQGDVSSLWVTAVDGGAKQITEGMRRKDGIGGMAWTPDGHIVYVASLSGMMQIWISGADGRDARPLTPENANNLNPSICPNGRFIVYNSDAGPKGRHIWRMELDGSRPKQLTTGSDESWPICSPESDWVLYLSLTPKYQLMKVPIDGGAPVQITQEPIIMPSISPDGKMILGTYAMGSINRVVTMPWGGGSIKMLFDIKRPKVHWSADGKSLLYFDINDGVGNIWSRSMHGGSPHQLTRFSDNVDIRWFAVSPSHGQLAVARGTVIRDLVRILDLK